MDKLVKKFENCLTLANNSNPFYYEADRYWSSSSGIYDNLTTILDTPLDKLDLSAYQYSPSIFIQLLDKHDFEFKREHFDKFIRQSTYMLSKSFLVSKGRYNYGGKGSSRTDSITAAIEIMFDKFDPDKKQLKRIVDCYKKTYYGGGNQTCIEILVKKGHIFTDAEQKILINGGVSPSVFLLDKGVTYEYLVELLKDPNSYKEIDSMRECFQFVLEQLEEMGKSPDDEMLHGVIKSQSNSYYSKLDNTSYYNSANSKEKLEFISKLIDQISEIPSKKTFQSFIKRIGTWSSVEMFLKSGYKVVKDDVELLVKNKLYTVVYQLIENKLIQPDTDTLYLVLGTEFWLSIKDSEKMKDHESLAIIQYFEEKGVEPDMDIFRRVCQTDANSNSKTLEYLSSKYKLVPDKQCLDMCLRAAHSREYDVLNFILGFKIVPDYHSLESYFSDIQRFESEGSRDGINHLITFGLNIGNSEMKLLIRYRVELNGVDRFTNVDFNNELYYCCHISRCLPPSFVNKFEQSLGKNIVELRSMFKNPILSWDKERDEQWSNILKLMEESGVKPDRYCIENIFQFYEDHRDDTDVTTMINKLLDSGCKVTPRCLVLRETKNIGSPKPSYLITKDEAVKQMNDEFGITPEKMTEPFDQFDLSKLS